MLSGRRELIRNNDMIGLELQDNRQRRKLRPLLSNHLNYSIRWEQVLDRSHKGENDRERDREGERGRDMLQGINDEGMVGQRERQFTAS